MKHQIMILLLTYVNMQFEPEYALRLGWKEGEEKRDSDSHVAMACARTVTSVFS